MAEIQERMDAAHRIERHDTWQCDPARYLAMEHLEREPDLENPRPDAA